MVELELARFFVNGKPELAIAYAVSGLVGLRKSGFQTDVDEVTSYICDAYQQHEVRDEIEGCATLIRNAEFYIDSDNWNELRMFDEIVISALEQNLY